MLLYRLAKTIRATDLTGEGAKRAGGRWNHAGVPVVYTAENGALAILEVLQYADISDINNFSMLTINVPDDVSIQRVLLSTLPNPGAKRIQVISVKPFVFSDRLFK